VTETGIQIPILVPQAVTVAVVLGLALGAVGLIVGLLALRREGRLSRHYSALMTGADGEDLAAALEAFTRRLSSCEQRIDALELQLDGVDTTRVKGIEARLDDLDTRLRQAVQHVRLVRYSAFDDAGGDQSFTLALLDESGDGVVVSSLYGREASRVYAKPISNRTSPYTLTAEEANLLDAIEHSRDHS
jgi:hypothetical protein